METVEKKPTCAIADCGEPIPEQNMMLGGQTVPLCAHHCDVLKVVLWAQLHVRVQVNPQLVVPEPGMPLLYGKGLR